MKRLLLFVVLCSSMASLSAQTFKAYVKAGDKAVANNDFNAAIEYFRTAMEMKPTEVSLFYKYADAARQYHAFEIAEEYYLKVLESDQRLDFPLSNYWMGMVKKQTGDYAAALDYFKKYLGAKQTRNEKFRQLAKSEIEQCKWAIGKLKSPDDLQIQQLNKRINTSYSEFGALQRGDTIYYSSYRFKNKADEHDPPRRIAKVLQSVKGAKGKALRRKFNAVDKNTAHTTFNRKGDMIFFTICDYTNSTEIQCQIYSRKIRIDKRKRRIWGKTTKLPASINMEGYTSTQPSIGYDPITKESYLFFVSDRPAGKGKLDIWRSTISKQGKFSKPVNLEEINTPENDITPFYYAKAQTLFFSSEGYQGLGGYDIFKSRWANDRWSVPAHTGYPLNSSYNDLYFSLNPDSTVALFSSNRLGSFYLDKKNKACCNDIYKVNFKQADTLVVPPMDSLLVEQPSFDSTAIVIDLPIPKVTPPVVVKEPETLDDFLPLQLYFHNDEPDRRTKRKTTRQTYEQTFLKYYALKEEYKYEYGKPLSPQAKAAATQALETFFEQKVKLGFDYLNKFSNILLARLQDGDRVEIFIKGYTSPRAKGDYNLSLGKRRISSLRNHFEKYENGVFKKYLRSEQLIISERSFGETTAASVISDDLNDKRNSVYSVLAAKERRVEIVEIITDEF